MMRKLSTGLVRRLLRVVAVTILLVAPASIVSAATPSDAQMRAAMKSFPELRDIKVSAFGARDGAAFATFKTKNGKSATLVGYLPDGRKVPVVAVLTPKAAVGSLFGGDVNAMLKDLTLSDVTAMFAAPGDNRAKIVTSQLPKVLREPLGKVIGEFYLSAGINLFGRLAARPVGIVGDALKVVGLRTHDDISLQARIGVTREITLRKRTAWRNPFQLRNVNGKPTSLKGLTLRVTRGRTGPEIGGWGQLTLNRKAYFLYAKYVKTAKGAGKAYGLDTRAITLQSIADFAAAMPWGTALASRGLDRLPLERVSLSNPAYRSFDTVSGAAPSFENMMLVAASPKVTLPDQKALPGTRGLVRGTIGPLLYAHGDATIFGRKVGNIGARMSIHGLVADARVGIRNIGPIRFESDVAFRLGPKKAGKKRGKRGAASLDHEMTLTGRAGLHGLVTQTIRLTADVRRLAYRIPASCPANPLSIIGSVPMSAGLVLNGIRDFKVDVGVSDCYSAAILALVRDPKRMVGYVEGVSDEMVGLGAAAAKELSRGVVAGEKAVRAAWKGSVDAGQTAANTVKTLDRRIASLGSRIGKTGNEIKKLGKSIKSLGKKIGGLFKKKKKKKKREKARKEAQKRKLEQQRRSARKARAEAARALGTMSPNFNPAVIDARSALSGLRYELKRAEARTAFARQLKTDFANDAKRRKIMALVDAKAIIGEHLPASATAASLLAEVAGEGKAPVVGVNTSFAGLNRHLSEKRVLIEEQIVTAALEAAMEKQLASITPDPENTVPADTPVRIVGEHNMCLEAYRRAKVKGFDAMKSVRADIRIDYCHADSVQSAGRNRLSTQRFRFTSAGTLQALFGRDPVCFNARGARIETDKCNNSAEQVFFVDPTIDAIRPLASASAPQCLDRRNASRPGAQLQLNDCAYDSDGKSVSARQTWKAALWRSALPPKKPLPMLESLWAPYGQGYAAPEIRADKGAVSISGMIRIRPRDQGSRSLDFGEPIDVLSPDMRPDRRLVFNVNAHNAPARIDILPNGRILWVTGTRKNPWVSLGNVNFVTRGMKPLSLKSGCRKSKWKAYRDPSYSRKGDTVYLGGLVSCKFDKRKLIAMLPEGFRPNDIRVFNVNAQGASARVDVYPNGQVWWMAGGGARHGWVSLEGVSFNLPRAETSRLQMSKGCRAYGGGYAPPRIDIRNGKVRLSGLVSCSSAGKADFRIAVLPRNARPSGRLAFDQNVHLRGVRLDILANGNVNLRGTMPNNWVSLEGMVFSTAGARRMTLKW